MVGIFRDIRGSCRCRMVLTLLAVAFVAGYAATANASSPLSQTALPHWAVARQDGLAVELIQRPIDLTEAFFQGRGFTPSVSRQIADACVMAVVVKNLSAARTIRINLGDWRVVADGHKNQLRLEADWHRQWGKERVAPSAQIAFRYAMLPTVERLGGGDWLQGMVTANLGPGQRFDLQVRWTENGVPEQAWVRNVLCSATRSAMEK